MPINNELKPRIRPIEDKFGKKPYNNFANLLENIQVTLSQAPAYGDLIRHFVSFATATYEEQPYEFFKNIQDLRVEDLIFYKTVNRELLPGTLETVRLNFLIEGISIQEVTHILRYRNATFSAECSGEKWWTDKTFVVPTSVENSDMFNARYRQICEDAKKLYCDMIDSKEISIRDARYILPRATETFYFMSMNLADTLHFIYDRIDTQIQPFADNVMAYKMIQQVIYKYPIIAKVFGRDILNKPAKFYTTSARKTLGSNMYPPDKNNDTFEYNEEDFIYKKTRDKFNGVDRPERRIFEGIKQRTQNLLEEAIDGLDSYYGKDFFEQDIDINEIKKR